MVRKELCNIILTTLIILVYLTHFYGNNDVYVIGEVDYQLLRFDHKWGTNLCLRYSYELAYEPSELVMNYSLPLNLKYFKISNYQYKVIISDIEKLISDGNTKIVSLTGTYNPLYGYFDMYVIDSKIVPITMSYLRK
jgi:hypothetical protein